MAVVLLGDGQFRSADPTMEDYDTPDDFAEEIDTAGRKRKAPEVDKTKKPKWKSDETDHH